MGTSAPAFVSVDEYLHTTYHPDCDYVDGELEGRNMGHVLDSHIQEVIQAFLHA